MNALAATVVLLALAAPVPPAETAYQDALYHMKILGDVEGALAALDRAAAAEPSSALTSRILAMRVDCLWTLRRDDEAERAYRRLGDWTDLPLGPDLRKRLAEFTDDLAIKEKIKELEARSDEEKAALEAEYERKREELRRGKTEETKVEEPAPPPREAQDPAEVLARERKQLQRDRIISMELVEEARRSEEDGDLIRARALLLKAMEVDPRNMVASQFLQQLGRSRMTEADVKRTVELERVLRRELAVRDTERLIREAKERWAVGKFQDAANLAGTVLEIRYEYPEFAGELLDLTAQAMNLLRRADARGARPWFVPTKEDGKVEEGWLDDVYRILRSVSRDPDTDYRFYALHAVQRRAETDAPDVAVADVPAKVTRAEEYPTRALLRLVEEYVAPGTWDGRNRYVTVAENWLVVRHSAAVREQVRRLLQSLARPPRKSDRIGFDLVVVARSDLAALTSVLSVRFDRHGPAAVASIDALDLAVWSRRTRWARHVGRASGAVGVGRPIRLDATRLEYETVGFERTLSGGRAVTAPIGRRVRQGALLDTIVLPRDGGGTIVGIEGFVALLFGPYSIQTPERETLRRYCPLRASFDFAGTVPPGGALLITGLVNPFRPRSDDEVLCLIVAPGGLPTASTSAAATTGGGVVLGDLAADEDAPGPSFFQEFAGIGPERTHSKEELVTAILGERGIVVENRSGVLHASGDRREDGRRALAGLLAAREDLFEIRARAVAGAKPPDGGGPELAIEPKASGRAWLVADDAPRLSGSDRLKVGSLTAGSLQCVHLCRVESNSFVEHYEPKSGHPGARPGPVFGRVGRGLVLEIRAVADGDDTILSLLIRSARLRGIEELRFGSETSPLPMSFPDQVVERVRVRTRVTRAQRLIVTGVPDPFGESGDRLTIELEVRRISR